MGAPRLQARDGMRVDLRLFVQEGGGCGTEMSWDSPQGGGNGEVRVVVVVVIVVIVLPMTA
jgi:hypothetical protein